MRIWVMAIFSQIPMGDCIALALFVLMRLGYGAISRRISPHSVNTLMDKIRQIWMARMLGRENRIMDSTLMGHVIHSASFFASTSIILIAGALTALTNPDRLTPAIETVGFIEVSSRVLLQMKLLTLVAVLADGFFKFTWSVRQLNYTLALIGAAPPHDLAPADAKALADAEGRVFSNAVGSFNDGMRGYYFALAVVAWLFGSIFLVAATFAVVVILLRRQIFSSTARALRVAAGILDG